MSFGYARQMLVPNQRLLGFGDGIDDWASPYNGGSSSPPLVGVIPDSSTTAGAIGTTVGGIARQVFDFFRPQQPSQPSAPVATPTPLWVYALLGVGGVVALGFVARKMRRPRRAVAGYRRRHSRR